MYFVSTREENDHKALFGGAWGYFRDKASAVDAVQRNVTDIHETIYQGIKTIHIADFLLSKDF